MDRALTPHVDVRRERTRLRFLNASSSRVFNLGFTDGRSFAVIGTDGGLLPAPHTAKRVQLSPGERAEIVVELSQGDTTVLRSFEQTLGTDFLNHRWAGGNDRFDLLKLRAGPDLEPSPDLPARLVRLPEPDLSAVDTTRSFRVSSRTINRLSMDMNRIDARVRPGSVEIWEVEGVAVPHNLHLHGVQFRILDVDGTPPDPLHVPLPLPEARGRRSDGAVPGDPGRGGRTSGRQPQPPPMSPTSRRIARAISIRRGPSSGDRIRMFRAKG